METISDDLRRYEELAKAMDEGIADCIAGLNDNYHLRYSGCVQWSLDTDKEIEEFREKMEASGKRYYEPLIEVLELRHSEFLHKLEDFRQKIHRDLRRLVA